MVLFVIVSFFVLKIAISEHSKSPIIRTLIITITRPLIRTLIRIITITRPLIIIHLFMLQCQRLKSSAIIALKNSNIIAREELSMVLCGSAANIISIWLIHVQRQLWNHSQVIFQCQFM